MTEGELRRADVKERGTPRLSSSFLAKPCDRFSYPVPFATPTAARNASQPTTLFALLVLQSLALPAPYFLARTSDTTRLRREPRLPVLRSSPLRRVDEAVEECAAGVLRSLVEGGHASAGFAEDTRGTTAVKPWGSTSTSPL